MTDYVFFDVETPNRFHERICSIGVVRTDGQGSQLSSDYFFVNPEQGFDPHNTRIHGITASSVREAATFPDLWNSRLAGVLQGGVLVAHNSGFDLRVLNKSLLAYGIPFFEAPQLCTKRLAKQHVPDLQRFRLPDLCEYFGVSLGQHHNALDDALGCSRVFWAMQEMIGGPPPAGMPYVWRNDLSYEHSESNTSTAMRELYGIVVGIGLDGTVRWVEHSALLDWQQRHRLLRTAPFFRDAFHLIDAVLADGAVTTQEWEVLLEFCRPFLIDGVSAARTVAAQQLIGILRGILADGAIKHEEAVNLRLWLDENAEFTEFDGIRARLDQVLADGIITLEEERELEAQFARIIDPITGDGVKARQSERAAIEVRAGESSGLQGCKVCLTGEFTSGSRSAVGDRVVQAGGQIANSVSGKVSYVVVGGLGSDRYSFGSYGGKVKKAMELQEKGKPITILTEDQLLEMLGDLV